jgi:hypothetical protein
VYGDSMGDLASSLCNKIDLTLESMISSTLSLSIIVSLSRIISLRSIETTSPVSSSTKSSCHVFNTRAANFLPIYFLSPVLDFFPQGQKFQGYHLLNQ